MRRRLVLFSLLLITPFFAMPALALPAPMPEEELMAKSDLVALVRVLWVTCTGVTKDAETGEELPSYLANLELLEVKKGDQKPGATIFITWRSIPKGMLGPWTVIYYPGEEVVTHLIRDGESYKSTWWNAKGEDVKEPVTTELPTTLGETVSAPSQENQ